jgi:hypothetical protein
VSDEDAGRRQRQRINEAIAVVLRHGRVHHDRAVEAVTALHLQLAADELLPADLKRRHVAGAARVDDAAGLDLLPARQRHAGRGGG